MTYKFIFIFYTKNRIHSLCAIQNHPIDHISWNPVDLIIDKFDDNLKLREFAARHHIPAVSDIGSSKLKYLVTERNKQFLFKDLRRKKSHF